MTVFFSKAISSVNRINRFARRNNLQKLVSAAMEHVHQTPKGNNRWVSIMMKINFPVCYVNPQHRAQLFPGINLAENSEYGTSLYGFFECRYSVRSLRVGLHR